MKSKSIQRTCVFARLAALLLTVAVAGEDRFTLKAPNGIAFSEAEDMTRGKALRRVARRSSPHNPAGSHEHQRSP